MKYRVEFEFLAGEDVCSYQYGEFCAFLEYISLGQRYRCSLFKEEIFADKDGMGKLRRLPECKKRAKRIE
jgi:hypothetical protein